jgi:hypothetical protein
MRLVVWRSQAMTSVRRTDGEFPLKIIVISGTCLIGAKSVAVPHQSGHEVIAANRPARFGR